MLRDVEFWVFRFDFGIDLHRWNELEDPSYVFVLTAHIFERRWCGDTHGDRETKAFVVTESSKYDLRREIKYPHHGLDPG